MPFKPDEFLVGMIAYFTINDLRRHPLIRTTNPTRDKKRRPFVCYAECDGLSYWTALTGTMKRNRRTVDRKWLRVPPGYHYACEQIIVSDGGSSFFGPIKAFAEQSARYDIYPGLQRPFLLGGGIEELKMMVRSRRGVLPAPQRAAA